MGRRPKAKPIATCTPLKAGKGSKAKKAIATAPTPKKRTTKNKTKVAEDKPKRRTTKTQESAKNKRKAAAVRVKTSKKMKAATGTSSKVIDTNHSSLAVNEPSKHPHSVAISSKRNSKANNVSVRRSCRLSNSQFSKNLQGKGDIVKIDLTNCDGGEVELHAEPIGSDPTRAHVGRPNLKRGDGAFASETGMTDISYKTLYIHSQKEIEALMEEKYKQAIELSYMRGKLEAYEYMIGNMKNMFTFSTLKKATDPEMNMSDGIAPDALNAEM